MGGKRDKGVINAKTRSPRTSSVHTQKCLILAGVLSGRVSAKYAEGHYFDSQNPQSLLLIYLCFQLKNGGRKRRDKKVGITEISKEEICLKLKTLQEQWELEWTPGEERRWYSTPAPISTPWLSATSFPTTSLLFLKRSTVTQPRKNGQESVNTEKMFYRYLHK